MIDRPRPLKGLNIGIIIIIPIKGRGVMYQGSTLGLGRACTQEENPEQDSESTSPGLQNPYRTPT